MKTLATFLVALLVHELAGAAPLVKPEYIALTPANFGDLGFKEDFRKSDTTGTTFGFHYPEEIDSRVGWMIRITIKRPDGVIESESVNSISKSPRYVQVSFDSKHDVGVSVEYRCNFELPKACQGEREYGIGSITSFIARHHGK